METLTYEKINEYCQERGVRLIAVSKTKPMEAVQALYDLGQRDFAENKVQELLPKYEALPKDIRWHVIGHLQSNKVKQIAPFVSMIHSVDSVDLLHEIDKQAAKCGQTIECLLQIFIATEETKYGFSFYETEQAFETSIATTFPNLRVRGLMGMASFTENKEQVRNEFRGLADFFRKIKIKYPELALDTLSMGMSGDYQTAIEEGSTMVRVGSAIFGSRAG